MKRSTFLIISAIVSVILGGGMLVFPDIVAAILGATTNPFSAFIMRELALIIICSGILNFLVRNESSSFALKVILIFNIAYHGTMIPMDLIGILQGVFTFKNLLGILAFHIFIAGGSVYFLVRLRPRQS